jgi:menaquinone-dependent protoporphyrinogen IX oxidase
MNVLVAYSSKHGSTREIAHRMGDPLRADGLTPDVREIAEVSDLTAYDAVVIGSAVYMGSWRKEATEFARKHRAALAARPVWLFSSGPLGEPNLEEPQHVGVAVDQSMGSAADPTSTVASAAVSPIFLAVAGIGLVPLFFYLRNLAEGDER